MIFKKGSRLLIYSLLTTILCCTTAQGSSDKNTKETTNVKIIETLTGNPLVDITPGDITSGKRYKIIGIIRLVGNANFARLVVSTDKKLTIHLELAPSDREKIHAQQYRYIQIEGVVSRLEMRLANGKKVSPLYRMKVEKFTILRVKDRDTF